MKWFLLYLWINVANIEMGSVVFDKKTFKVFYIDIQGK